MEDKPPHKTDGIANLAESQGRGPDADAKLSAEDVPILLSDLDHAALQAKFAPLLEGRLSDEEREALRGEDPLGFALFSPLPAAQADELATRLMNEIGVADPRGGQTTTASEAVPPTPVISLAEARARRSKITAVLIGVAALAAGWFIIPRSESLDYAVTETVSQPAVTLSGPAPATTPEGIKPLSRDHLLTLRLNPKGTASQPRALRAFVERDGQLVTWPVQFQQADGAFLLRQGVRELFGSQPAGRLTVWLVIGKPEALPKTPEEFTDLRRRDPSGRTGDVFIDRRDYNLIGPASAPESP